MTDFIPTRHWFVKHKTAKLIAVGYDFDDGRYHWFIDYGGNLRMSGVCKTQELAIRRAKAELQRMYAKIYLDHIEWQRQHIRKMK